MKNHVTINKKITCCFALFLYVFCIEQNADAQDAIYYQCGSAPVLRSYPSQTIPITFDVLVVKVYVHDFVGISVDTLIHRLQIANTFFAPHKIAFMLSGHQTYSTTPQYMGIMDTENPDAIEAINDRIVPGHLNLFLHGILHQGKQDVNTWFAPDGVTYYIPGNAFSIGNLLIGNRLRLTTIAHQLGHCLGLYDTDESIFGSENAGRLNGCANCTTAGDLLCATNAARAFADSMINFQCLVNGSTVHDACGNTINGFGVPENLMSETKESCKTLVVDAQGDRARSFLVLSSGLSPTIADNALTINSSATISSGTQAFGTKTSITIQPSSYTINGSARVDFSSKEITVKPGASFVPSSGAVHFLPGSFN